MKNIKINTFLIIYFSKYDTFYIANFEWIIAKTINTTKIKYEEFKNNCQQLKIIFPGILNIINYL
jgi:penicillin-binding protein-related factor A (putative recombinase)